MAVKLGTVQTFANVKKDKAPVLDGPARRRLARAYEAGVPLRDLQERFRCSERTIRRIAAEEGARRCER